MEHEPSSPDSTPQISGPVHSMYIQDGALVIFPFLQLLDLKTHPVYPLLDLSPTTLQILTLSVIPLTAISMKPL